MFVHLRWHSTYSLLEAIGSIPQVLEKTEKLWMNAICLTEYYFFSGMVEFYQKATKNKIKPIIWIELGFLSDVNYILQQRYIGNIVLIAQNKEWYYNLMKIITESNKHKKNDKPCIDFEILKKHKKWLYILIGGEKSVFWQMLLQNENAKKISDLTNELISIVGQENFLVDIIAQDYSIIPDLKKINDGISTFAKEKWIKTLVNSNFHYINQEDKKYFEIAMAIKDGKKIYDGDRRKVIWDYHIMSESEIYEIMSKNGFDEEYVQNLMNNNIEIADSINTKVDLYQKLFPIHQTPEDMKKMYAQYEKEIVAK